MLGQFERLLITPVALEMRLEVSIEVIGVRLSLHVLTRGKPDGPGFPLVAPLSVPSSAGIGPCGRRIGLRAFAWERSRRSRIVSCAGLPRQEKILRPRALGSSINRRTIRVRPRPIRWNSCPAMPRRGNRRFSHARDFRALAGPSSTCPISQRSEKGRGATRGTVGYPRDDIERRTHPFASNNSSRHSCSRASRRLVHRQPRKVTHYRVIGRLDGPNTS